MRRPRGVAMNPALQEGAERGRQGRRAVDPLHRDRAEGTGAGGLRERFGGGSQPWVLGGQPVRVRGPQQQGLAAALHVERRFALDEHHQGARLATGLVRGTGRRFGPAEGRTVSVRRVGGGQYDGPRTDGGAVATAGETGVVPAARALGAAVRAAPARTAAPARAAGARLGVVAR